MSTINVVLSSSTVCDLLCGRFTYEACDAICEYLSDCSDGPWHIGDIAISFAEVLREDLEEGEEESIIAELSNGNVIIAL